jgi:hypothetical protein
VKPPGLRRENAPDSYCFGLIDAVADTVADTVGCANQKPHRNWLSGNQLLWGSASERRGRDSNPRWSFPHTGFRDQHNRPLCHLSLNGGPFGARS